MNSENVRPPRWAELVVRLLLRPRDRETISGDLLEQYREVEVAARGERGAAWWYIRQGLSLADGIVFGLALGVTFGCYDLYDTWRDPQADDSALALFIFYGPMFAAWLYAGFRAGRKGSLGEAVKAGAILAFVTFAVFDLCNFVRVNVFFDSLIARSDWQDMVGRFHASGSTSIRTFVNLDYLRGAPFKIAVASGLGGIFALAGGAAARVGKLRVR